MTRFTSEQGTGRDVGLAGLFTLMPSMVADVVDADDPHGAWEGRKGGLLTAFSTTDGAPLVEFELPAPPVWDGMAAVQGRVCLATQNGVVCLGGENRAEARGD